MLNIGPMELLLILLVALIFVGPKKLPELGRTIGKSLRELRKAQDEVRSTLNLDEPPKAAPRKAAQARPRPARPAETARPTAERDEPGNGAAGAGAGAAAGAAVGSAAAEAVERPAEAVVGPDAPSEAESAQDEPAVEPGVPPDVTEDVGPPEDVAPVDPPRSAEGE